jgi:aminoglycoside phosphotransferase (APT) family kinase protein
MASLEETSSLLDRFCMLMVELHRLDWRPFCEDSTLYEVDPSRILTDWSAAQRQMIQKFELPGFLPVIDWLESHVPSDGIRPAVVHHDFHANNVFLNSSGSMTVIDWTQVGVFDYRADLSWTLLIMGDLGQKPWADHILREYETKTGQPVGSLNYFNVISHLKQLLGTVITLKYGMQAIGLNPVKAPTLEQEVPLLKLFSQRVTDTTGIKIDEVEHLTR